MTIGIYKLSFSDGSIYIGQSIDIEKRYKRHLYNMETKSSNNYKLLEAYSKYGKPKLNIEQKCNITELNSYEDSLILSYSITHNILNIKKSSKDMPIQIGDKNSNAKFTNSQITEVLFLLTDTIYYNTQEIIERTGVNYNTIIAIKNFSVHRWLEEKFPERYNILRDLKAFKYKLISPDNQIFEFSNTAKFSKEHGLDKTAVSRVLKGERVSHFGWTKFH